MHRIKSANLQCAIGATILTERKKCLVAKCKKRATESRKHLELVLWPFERGKRIAKRDDLLTFMERATADQHVGNLPRLQSAHVGPGNVSGKGAEPAEQECRRGAARSGLSCHPARPSSRSRSDRRLRQSVSP